MQLPNNVKDILLNQKTIQLATASAEGAPNVCHIGCKQLREDGKIVLIDNYMKKTKANVLENPQVAILLRGEKGAYQLKGTGEYVDEGEAYDAAYQWFRAMTDKYPAKGADHRGDRGV
ncbi:MAG: pyridoxamine 5'-phosphate oxidase family protein [Chloroflexota bacterium]|jgi:predicted pyridoxine 5'-phosphate oxidase superfamily flavin-nucleotide-binding protein|nr:pyridoxamine 5'-phosphate oxidase family protein [Chloroflexota bacterium]